MAFPGSRRVCFALIGLVGGCDADVRFSDSIDTEVDFADAADSSLALHDPYVVGARFDVRVDGAADGVKLVSSDARVLALEGHGARADAVAVAPGRAEISLVDGGGEIVSAVEIEVRMPTRVVLHAAAAVLVDRADVPTEAMSPRIVAGGEAMFLVQYFDGATRLSGSGGLAVTGSEGLEVAVVPELLAERRDWLQLGAADAGEHEIDLAVAGQSFTRVDVDVVDASEVADVDVFASDDGDRGVVIASAYDLDGEPLFGVPFEWTLDAGAQLITSDVVRPGASRRPATLAARFGELEGEVDVEDDSAAVHGCAIGGGDPSAWAGLFVLVIGCRRRRR